jgi:Caspase domain
MASAAQSGQQIPGLFGLFNGLISTAIVDSARRDWQARPFSDYNCLARHGLSAEQLANQGIGPEDPRARQILASCAFAAPAPVPVSPQPTAGAIEAPPPSSTPVAPSISYGAPPNPDYATPSTPSYAAPPAPNHSAPPNPSYVVNGLELGAPFGAPPDAAVGYACHASDDYPGFAWCQWRHAETRKFGPETVWMSVFRSRTNATVEITQAVDPAFFRPGDVEREIQRLSRDFGQQARVIDVDLPAGGRAVIAAWGVVTLTPLDSSTLDALRRGAPVHSGLLVGALGDLRASARLGVPVYGLGGGAGFIWSANYNSSGKGVLRITAVDPSAVSPAAPTQPVAAAPSPATTSPVAPAPAGTLAPTIEAARGGGADQSAKAVVAAIQPSVSADRPNTPASISAFASQRTEAKAEPPGAPLASPASPASRLGRRVALIVANGSYREAPLANPAVDADIVKGSLERIGFAVTVKKDLDLDGFEQAISEFAETTRGADVALFYFAGHGFSIAEGGRQENLLMATSANLSAKTALALEGGGEPLEHVEDTIVGRARATLIFIDACRNIPTLASRGIVSRGFAPIDASRFEGAYVVLSTRAGQTAEDGAGAQGSPFARAFASVLPTPGLRIEDAYSRIREQVRSETSGAQVPDSVRSDLPEGGVVLVENTTK